MGLPNQYLGWHKESNFACQYILAILEKNSFYQADKTIMVEW